MAQMRETLGRRIEIRALEDDLARWQETAQRSGIRSISEWIRRTLNDEVVWSNIDRGNRLRFDQSLRNAADQFAGPVYARTVLENGIRVVTESTPGARSVALGIYLDCGEFDEGAGESGLARLCERMLFQGTKTRDASAIASQIAKVGGQVDATTASDHICLRATVISDYSFHALELFGDLLLESTFSESALTRERRVLHRGVEESAEQARRKLRELLRSTLLARRTQCAGEFTREDVIRFVHRQFTPDRMIVAAAGGLQHDQFVAQVRDVFWRLVGTHRPSQPQRSEHDSCVRVQRGTFRLARFAFGIPIPIYAFPDCFALQALARILDFRLSRFVHDEARLVHELRLGYSEHREFGLFTIEGSVEPDDICQCVEAVFDCLRGIVSGADPVQDEELRMAKDRLRTEQIVSYDSIQSRMGRLASQELYFQTYFPTKKVLQAIDGLDPAMIGRFGGPVLADGVLKASLAVLGPDEAAKQEPAFKRLLSEFQNSVRSWRANNRVQGRANGRSTGAVEFQTEFAVAEPDALYLRRGVSPGE